MSIQLKSPAEIAKLREANLVVADVLDALEAAAQARHVDLGPERDRRVSGSSSSRASRPSSATTATRRCSARRSTRWSSTASRARTSCSRTGTSCPSTSAPSRTAGAAIRPAPSRSATVSAGRAGADADHQASRSSGPSPPASRATAWGTSAGRCSRTPRRTGYSVVRQFVGHGIGRAMHEEPHVPNYGDAGKGRRLSAGLVLAIEPMVNAGRPGGRWSRTTGGRL